LSSVLQHRGLLVVLVLVWFVIWLGVEFVVVAVILLVVVFGGSARILSLNLHRMKTRGYLFWIYFGVLVVFNGDGFGSHCVSAI
jgi:thiol:disulfide interchange protein